MKKVVLTGGTRGIGLAVAQTLLKGDQYELIIVSKSAESIESAKSQLKGFANVSFEQLDLTQSEQIDRFAGKFKASEIYGLVNNAAICQTATLESQDLDVWERVIDTNLNGVFRLTSRLVGKICDHGRIVNLSSQLGQEGRAGYSAYCASKFAIVGLTKVWAKELGPRGVTVNAVCPGWVDTEMSRIDLARIAKEKGMTAEAFREEICRPLELKRFTRPEEVASLIAYLLSEGASGITGRDWLMNTIWNQE